MTKAQLKSKYEEWNKNITELENRQKEIFEMLQNLNEKHGNGCKYCSVTDNVLSIIRLSPENAYFVIGLKGEYDEITGKMEALRDLAIATNNFEI